jgi:NUDIX domain
MSNTTVVTLERLENELAPFPHVNLKKANPKQIDKLIEYLNARQARVCNLGDAPYCCFEYVVVRVFHQFTQDCIIELIERKKRKQPDKGWIRPMNGVNTKMFHGEKPEVAAHRALHKKLGIVRFGHLSQQGSHWDKLKNGSGIPGLYIKNMIHLFYFFMPDSMYNSDGHGVRRGEYKEVHFDWVPVNEIVSEEKQLLP